MFEKWKRLVQKLVLRCSDGRNHPLLEISADSHGLDKSMFWLAWPAETAPGTVSRYKRSRLSVKIGFTRCKAGPFLQYILSHLYMAPVLVICFVC